MVGKARPTGAASYQQRVDRHFDAQVARWRDLYTGDGLPGAIFQRRRALALNWIDQLALPRQAQVLEIGCGAGLLAMDLALRGYAVKGIDSSPAMVELARDEVRNAGLEEQIAIDAGDVHSLNIGDAGFELVIALGVLPWLHTPQKAMSEMSRVLRPGGYVLLTSANKFRLRRLLDPRFTPFPGRELLKRTLVTIGAKEPPAPQPRFDSNREVRAMASRLELQVERYATVGFGPFTLLGKPILLGPRAKRIEAWLQARLDAGWPGISACGDHYVILARKPLQPPELAPERYGLP